MNIYYSLDPIELFTDFKKWCEENPIELQKFEHEISTPNISWNKGIATSEETKKSISDAKRGVSINKGSKRPWAKDNLKYVNHRAFGNFLITNPSNETFTITNLKEFCKIHNLSYTSMSSLANKKYPCEKYKGYKCIKLGYTKIHR